MKKQKENSHEGITWSEMGKQNVQAEKVYCARDSRYRGIMGIAKEEVRFRNNVYDSASNFE